MSAEPATSGASGRHRSAASRMPTSASRPGYPEDAVRWLAGEVPCDVVDLGAGTGQADAIPRRARPPGDRGRAASRDARAAAGRRAGGNGRRGWSRVDPARGGERRRRHRCAGLPLVRPRPGPARDRAGAAAGRPHRARLERPRRERDLGEPAERRDGRGGPASTTAPPSRSTRVVSSGRSSTPSSATSTRSTGRC